MRGRQIIFLAAMIALTLATTSEAGAIFTLGNNPPPGGVDEEVLLDGGPTDTTAGTTVFGTTNQSHLTVQFTSTQTLNEPSSGQAKIEATNDIGGPQIALTDVTISVPNGTFTDLIFNPFIVGGAGQVGTPGGTAIVTAIANDGTFSFPNFTLYNGNNFLTITTSGGETLSSVSISYPTGFTDLEQVRISGAVPEPASATVMAIGVAITAMVAFVLRRRNRRLVQAS